MSKKGGSTSVTDTGQTNGGENLVSYIGFGRVSEGPERRNNVPENPVSGLSSDICVTFLITWYYLKGKVK